MTDTASAPEIVRFCRDETCPSCGWPETYTAADTSTSPIVAARIGCSKCGWTAPEGNDRNYSDRATIELPPLVRPWVLVGSHFVASPWGQRHG